jgi:hypothetical protein
MTNYIMMIKAGTFLVYETNGVKHVVQLVGYPYVYNLN